MSKAIAILRLGLADSRIPMKFLRTAAGDSVPMRLDIEESALLKACSLAKLVDLVRVAMVIWHFRRVTERLEAED